MGVLNNNNFQEHIDPQARCMRHRGGSKKFVQQGRSHFCAQSVLPVREHGKMARTPLAAFFNSPLIVMGGMVRHIRSVQHNPDHEYSLPSKTR